MSNNISLTSPIQSFEHHEHGYSTDGGNNEISSDITKRMDGDLAVLSKGVKNGDNQSSLIGEAAKVMGDLQSEEVQVTSSGDTKAPADLEKFMEYIWKETGSAAGMDEKTFTAAVAATGRNSGAGATGGTAGTLPGSLETPPNPLQTSSNGYSQLLPPGVNS